MDPTNPVVVLCARGMEAEGAGNPSEAKGHFLAAWNAARDDYEASIAAHYVARHQDDAAGTLYWNQLALDRANAVGDDRILGFLASLHLNLAAALEQLGESAGAAGHYRAASDNLHFVPEGPYRNLVSRGVEAALARIGSP